MQNGREQFKPVRNVRYPDGVTVFLFAIVANLAAQLIVGVAAECGAVVTGNANFAKNDYFQLIAMLSLQLAFVAVPLVYYGVVKKATPCLRFGWKKPRPALSLAFLLPVLCIIGFMLPAFYFVTGLERIGYTLSEGVQLNTAGKWVLGVIAIVVIAPCVEEIVFRGFLLNGLIEHHSPVKAALLSALAFSLMHMNPEQTVYQFCLGFVCALATMASGNLLGGVIVHMFSNLLALLIDTPFGKPYNEAFAFLTKTPWGAVLTTVLAAAACGVAIWFVCAAIRKYSRPRQTPSHAVDLPDEKGEEPMSEENAQKAAAQKIAEKKTGRIMYIAGIGLCTVLWVFVFAAGMM